MKWVFIHFTMVQWALFSSFSQAHLIGGVMGLAPEADEDYVSCSLSERSGSSHAGTSSSAGVRLSWALDVYGLILSLRLSVASTLITLPRSLPLSSCLFLELQPLPRAACPRLCWSALSRLGPTGARLLSVLFLPALSSTVGAANRDRSIQIRPYGFGQHTRINRPLACIRILPRASYPHGSGEVSAHITAECVSLALYLGRKSDLPESER